MGNGQWNACLTEAHKCVDLSSKSVCTQDVLVGDEGSDSGSYSVFLARENTNTIGHHMMHQNATRHMPYNGNLHVPYTGSYAMPSSAAPPSPMVVPAMPANSRTAPMQDAHLYGNYGMPFEQQKAQHIQQTISGLLGDLHGSYPSSYTGTPSTSFIPPPMSGRQAQQPGLPPERPARSRTPSPGAGTRSKTKFCSECGAAFLDRAKFCSTCGAKRPPSRRNSNARDTEDMDAMLARKGIVLGKGVWAEALRWAKGPRREALLVLVNLGIVTERELRDDNTEITQDHIEDCVSIATEMLVRWPPHNGSPPLQEGKLFFEQRLAQLHLSRHPRSPTTSGYYNVLGT